MADITLADLLNANKAARNQALFGQFGMDANGNNEVGAWARRIAQPLGYNAASRAAFMNQLEPQRQAAIDGYIQSLLPENIEAQARAVGNQFLAAAPAEGEDMARQLAFDNMGLGAQEGARILANNRAIDARNKYLLALYSPEGRQQSFNNMIGAYNQAQDLNLNNLLSTGQFIEQRYQQNAADRARGGLNGLVGTLGGFAGMASGMGWQPFGRAPKKGP